MFLVLYLCLFCMFLHTITLKVQNVAFTETWHADRYCSVLELIDFLGPCPLEVH